MTVKLIKYFKKELGIFSPHRLRCNNKGNRLIEMSFQQDHEDQLGLWHLKIIHNNLQLSLEIE